MAAIVCQELHVESRIHILRLPSSPKPKPLTPHSPIDLAFKSCFREPNSKPHCEENRNYKAETFSNSNPNDQGGWSFIQGLSTNINKESLHDKETTYVHPQEKHYSSVRLSLKSLELCTENLGNETGTHDIIESDDIEFLSSCRGKEENLRTRREKSESSRHVLGAKKSKAHDFPPPLTTIRRGSESLQVRPYREDGRLVIEVTKVPPSSTSYFHAERSHGRLRLCLVQDHNPPCFDPEEEEEGGLEEEFEHVEEEMDFVEEEEKDYDEKETEEKEEGKEGIENKDGEYGSGYKETTNNNNIWRSNERMEKYERTCRGNRCKEGDHENKEFLINWVATS